MPNVYLTLFFLEAKGKISIEKPRKYAMVKPPFGLPLYVWIVISVIFIINSEATLLELYYE